MDLVLRVLAGLILVLFVFGPIALAIWALVVHLWRKRRGAKSETRN